MAKKELQNNFVIALKDVDGFFADLESGNIHMSGSIEEYKELLSAPLLKINSTKELGKFIRKAGLKKSECFLYWEGLLLDGYTLMIVEYNKGDAALLCDNKNLRYLTTTRK
ncbi:MAG TPA: hypothetical protein GXX14_12300 [Clostridiaceae bacterium]|nr:hypothetical protein [Clostridiaceae bacterium]